MFQQAGESVALHCIVAELFFTFTRLVKRVHSTPLFAVSAMLTNVNKSRKEEEEEKPGVV